MTANNTARAKLKAARLPTVQESNSCNSRLMADSDDDRPEAKPSSEARVRPPMVIRGGFIVHRRGNDTGMLTRPTHSRVYEHGDFDSAAIEARRLAAKFKREFAVFQEIGSAKPEPEITADPPIAPPSPQEATPELPARRVPVVERRVSRRRKTGGAA